MGDEEPAKGEGAGEIGTGLRLRTLQSQNRGICMEGSYPVGLHLGCGRHRWKGWTNCDFANADVNGDLRQLPFPDNHADAAVAIHVIEHFYQWEVEAVLTEWRRVLKPGGKLILELPSMNKVFAYIARTVMAKEPLAFHMVWNPLWGGIANTPEMVHKWGYTVEMMTELLKRVGFASVAKEEARYHFPERDMRLVATK